VNSAHLWKSHHWLERRLTNSTNALNDDIRLMYHLNLHFKRLTEQDAQSFLSLDMVLGA
jgi:hypothetical protein